jgi:pimeloyl-ACP methyl ester carboxylesterase
MIRVAIVLGFAASLYLALCVFLFFVQRSMLYFPQPASTRVDTLTLPVQDARVLAATRAADGPRAVLYFGGNAEDVSWTLGELSPVFPGRAIYCLHYRGYGGSTGSPTESLLFSDALALFDLVHGQHSEITIIGRSLGAAVGVYVASRRPVAKLALVTPFDRIADPAAAHYPFLPVTWILRDRYESGRYAPMVTAPTLIVAAAEDGLIPRDSTERLHQHFKPGVSTLTVLSGDHNSVSADPRYWPLLAGEER